MRAKKGRGSGSGCSAEHASSHPPLQTKPSRAASRAISGVAGRNPESVLHTLHLLLAQTSGKVTKDQRKRPYHLASLVSLSSPSLTPFSLFRFFFFSLEPALHYPIKTATFQPSVNHDDDNETIADQLDQLASPLNHEFEDLFSPNGGTSIEPQPLHMNANGPGLDDDFFGIDGIDVMDSTRDFSTGGLGESLLDLDTGTDSFFL